MQKFAYSISALALSGCSLFQPVTQPSEVTLEKALESVGKGLTLMRVAQGDMKTGMIASDVTVTLNLAASRNAGGKLTVDLGRDNPGTVVTSQKVGGSVEATSVQSRSNMITIKFVNIMTIPKDTLAYSKTSEELEKIAGVPKKAEWTVFTVPFELSPPK